MERVGGGGRKGDGEGRRGGRRGDGRVGRVGGRGMEKVGGGGRGIVFTFHVLLFPTLINQAKHSVHCFYSLVFRPSRNYCFNTPQ